MENAYGYLSFISRMVSIQHGNILISCFVYDNNDLDPYSRVTNFDFVLFINLVQ